jgi:hypothetical protein
MQDELSRGKFSNWLCYTVTKVCKGKTPPLPKDRKPGPAFEVMDEQEAQMEKMLAGMKVCLASVNAFSQIRLHFGDLFRASWGSLVSIIYDLPYCTI